MKISVIPGNELAPAHLEAWRGLQQSNPALASPYFCPEFTQAVAEVKDNVEVAILEEDNRVIGFLPYQRERHGVAVPVGGGLSDYQGIICAPEFECNPPELLKACRLVAFDFHHLLTIQKYFAPFFSHQGESPQIDVPRGYQAYVAERQLAGSEQIKKCANMMRRIEREIGPLHFVAHEADSGLLNQILAWKSQQYLASGKPDIFALSWKQALMERIHNIQKADFAGMLSLLYAGGRLIAGHFGMRSRTMWHYWFPSYDVEMSLYSPGVILLLKMAEYAPSAGLRVIDLGVGLSPYKQRLMNSSVMLGSGSVELPSWLALRRGARRKLRSWVVNSPVAGPARRLVHGIRDFKQRNCK